MITGLSMCITVDILQYSMPLAFLPSVLEDRGHSPLKIATAIGIYYWTGFLGGLIITSYQIWRMLYEKPQASGEHEVSDHASVVRHVKFLIFGLGVGTITLFVQAMDPSWRTHTICRFIQGFAGAFIFFYTFLLAVALFVDQQQVVAMTFVSCALNVAEVFGSFLGAVLFIVWGQRSVFWFLGVVSMINQVLLVVIVYMILPVEVPKIGTRAPLSRQGTPLVLQPPPSMTNDPDSAGGPQNTLSKTRTCGCIPKSRPGAWERLICTLQNREFACAIVLITMAAVVKGSVEEMLPFHADHRWHYDPLEIGKLFCTIAIAYILSACITGQFWSWLGKFQVIFGAYWLLMLGIFAWASFAVISYYKDASILMMSLAGYGVCLGMTHTPAALLLASVVDHEEGTAKEAVNGIWNTMWEAGGSLGFFLGGFLAEHYHEQMELLSCYAGCCAVAASIMVAIYAWPETDDDDCAGDALLKRKLNEEYDYGTSTNA